MDSLSKRQKSFFRAAQVMSTLSDHRYKVGCVIVNGHRIISSGYNSDTKCHAVQARVDQSHFDCDCIGKLHAETRAIIPLLKTHSKYKNATIYTYRETSDKHLAMSRPCERCLQLIRKLGITKIRYTTPDGYATELLEVL